MIDSKPIRPHAIFLHGGWRCGSTYLWNKFRELPEVTAFYEPFSEKLASYTRQDISKDVPSAWDSRHPTLTQPYAAEYLPLIDGRGVPLYLDHFAVGSYFSETDGSLIEHDYLSSLLAHAAGRLNHAVLGFSRSLGRVHAIKRHLHGFHVVMMRDPVQQWLSCRSYRNKSGFSYFELCQFLILALAPQDSLAARAARLLKLPVPPHGSFKQQLKFMRSKLSQLDDELSYRAFLTVYVLSYLHALPEADLIVDMEQLAEPDCAAAASERIAARTGLEMSFEDCSMPSHKTDCRVDFVRIHNSVLGWVLTESSRGNVRSSVALPAWRLISEKLALAPLLVRRIPAPPPSALDLGVRFGRRLRVLFKSPWL